MPRPSLRLPMVLALGLGVGAVVACGGKKPPPPIELPEGIGDTDLGLEELRSDLESTLLERYTQLSLGNIEALRDSIATGLDVFFLGPRPDDVVFGRDPEGLGEDRRLYADRNPTILSKNLDVHLSRDGAVGWLYDEVSYRVPHLRWEASIPIRLTSVYVRDVERWVQVAEHQSYGVDVESLQGMAQRGELVRAGALETLQPPDRELGGVLIGTIGRFVNGSSKKALVSSKEDSLVILPALEHEFRGKEAVEAPSLAEVFGKPSTVAVRRFRVQVAGSGRIAWVNANLLVRSRYLDDPIQVSLRSSFVLALEDDGVWRIVQAHISAPLRQEQLDAMVFGPG